MNFKIILYILLIILIYLKLNKKENFEDNFCSSFESYMKYKNITPFPIDVVYTWAGENNDNKNIRTRNNNELKYSIRSVIKFAPWVNRIFILMNPPKTPPSWFNKEYRNELCGYLAKGLSLEPNHSYGDIGRNVNKSKCS